MILLVAFLAILWNIHTRIKQSFTVTWIYSSATFCALLIGVTTTLSSFSQLNTVGSHIAWVLIAVLFVGTSKINSALIKDTLARANRKIVSIKDNFSWHSVVLCIFATGTLLSGLLYPVRNWDSLWHIMPRVTFWIQHQNYLPFYSPVGQQTSTYPFAAWTLAQIKLTTGGGDIALELVQWVAYLACIGVAASIARLLGSSTTGQRWVMLLVASTPMALLQATTTQYDLLTAYFVLSTAFLVLTLIKHPASNQPNLRLVVQFLMLGLLIGVGTTTKITFVIMTGPLLLWMAIVYLKKVSLKQYALLLCVVFITVALLIAPWLQLNYQQNDGDILGVKARGNNHILITDTSIDGIMTNFVRGASTPFGTPIPRINLAIEHGIEQIASWFGLDLDSLVNREQPTIPFGLSSQITNHDLAPYPVTMLALIIGGIMVLANRHDDKRQILLPYLACIVISFIAICTLISWQPYIVRTQLGVILLGLPLFGLIGNVSRPKTKTLYTLVVSASIALGIVVLLWNSSAPLVPQKYRPLNPGPSLGYWNASQQELQFAYALPEAEPLVGRIKASITTKNRTISVGGSNAINLPIYLFMSAIPDALWSYAIPNTGPTTDYYLEVLKLGEAQEQPPEPVSGYRVVDTQLCHDGETHILLRFCERR